MPPLIIAAACVDSLAAAVFSSHLVRVKSRRERSAQDAGAEGATAPETLRQTDRATDSIWKETPLRFRASADGIILSGTATDGASAGFRDGPLNLRGPV